MITPKIISHQQSTHVANAICTNAVEITSQYAKKLTHIITYDAILPYTYINLIHYSTT